MEGSYGVFLGGQAVGKVQVTKEGLYYRFSCRCKLSGDVVCRLVLNRDGIQESLGILTPWGDGFALETKRPAKGTEAKNPEFRILPNRDAVSGVFVPLSPQEPFAYLAKLKNAYYATRDGSPGVIIREKAGT